ncbi:MAG TPA: hypothetical protein VFB58_13140 [Chloroflexota bacterium]|nr:hypothetical protein [Chloroflexota bacterium]
MTHEHYSELLAVRGYLSPEDEADLSAHLHTCASCRATEAVYRRQDQFLRHVAWPVPPATLRDDVWDRLGPRLPWYRGLRLRHFFPLAAVLVIALLLWKLPVSHPSSGSVASLPAARSETDAAVQKGLKAAPVYGPLIPRVPAGPVVDKSLKISGRAANAKGVALKGCCPHVWRLTLRQPAGSAFGFEIIDRFLVSGPGSGHHTSETYVVNQLCGPLSQYVAPCTRRTYTVRSGEGDFVARWTVQWAFVQRTGPNQTSVYVFRTLTVGPKTPNAVTVIYPGT